MINDPVIILRGCQELLISIVHLVKYCCKWNLHKFRDIEEDIEQDEERTSLELSAIKDLIDHDKSLLLHYILESGTCNLVEVYLEDSKVSNKSIIALTRIMALETCKLKKLYLGYLSINYEVILALSDVLKKDTCKLIKLNLEGNNIGDEGVILLVYALILESCTLRTLELPHNNISDEGASFLADSLMLKSCNLKNLDLSFNNIGDEGATALANSIQLPSNINKLNLSNNRIGTDGGFDLAESLTHEACGLKNLNLIGNNIDSAVFRALKPVFKYNTIIKNFSCDELVNEEILTRNKSSEMKLSNEVKSLVDSDLHFNPEEHPHIYKKFITTYNNKSVKKILSYLEIISRGNEELLLKLQAKYQNIVHKSSKKFFLQPSQDSILTDCDLKILEFLDSSDWMVLKLTCKNFSTSKYIESLDSKENLVASTGDIFNIEPESFYSIM